MPYSSAQLNRPQELFAELSPNRPVAYAARMTEVEDTALMLRYQEGDLQAFETLYRRHKDGLYRYLLRLSLSPEVAEDVFQEAWSKIIAARKRYRPTAQFNTYLYRVAHNSFIDYLRRNKRHEHAASDDPDSRPATSGEPDQHTERSLARRRMLIALDELPHEQRDTFLLHEESGLNLDAIAGVTGVSRETAKSRLRYAMNKLKAALADPGACEETP